MDYVSGIPSVSWGLEANKYRPRNKKRSEGAQKQGNKLISNRDRKEPNKHGKWRTARADGMKKIDCVMYVVMTYGLTVVYGCEIRA